MIQKASGLSKQEFLNKNQLQELLLGVGLYLRDHEIACFVDEEDTSVPEYLVNSKMAVNDVDSISRVLQMLSNGIDHGLGYVFHTTGLYEY